MSGLRRAKLTPVEGISTTPTAPDRSPTRAAPGQRRRKQDHVTVWARGDSGGGRARPDQLTTDHRDVTALIRPWWTSPHLILILLRRQCDARVVYYGFWGRVPDRRHSLLADQILPIMSLPLGHLRRVLAAAALTTLRLNRNLRHRKQPQHVRAAIA